MTKEGSQGRCGIEQHTLMVAYTPGKGRMVKRNSGSHVGPGRGVLPCGVSTHRRLPLPRAQLFSHTYDEVTSPGVPLKYQQHRTMRKRLSRLKTETDNWNL